MFAGFGEALAVCSELLKACRHTAAASMRLLRGNGNREFVVHSLIKAD